VSHANFFGVIVWRSRPVQCSWFQSNDEQLAWQPLQAAREFIRYCGSDLFSLPVRSGQICLERATGRLVFPYAGLAAALLFLVSLYQESGISPEQRAPEL
jgi:hypothetical protein